PSRNQTVTVPADAVSISSPYDTPLDAMTIWSLVLYRTAGASSTTGPRLTVTGLPYSSHTPALSLNSTRVAPVTSSCMGCCAVAGPEAATPTRTHARTVEPRPLTIRPPHHSSQSERHPHQPL